MAAHVRQHCVINVLQGDIEIFADIAATRHDFKNIIRKIGGIGIVKSYPFDALDVGDAVNELRECVPPLCVETVARRDPEL